MAQKKKKGVTPRDVIVTIIRVGAFILYPAIYSTAFSGMKNLVEQLAAGGPLEGNSFISTLIAVCVATILCGRIFCGYLCAFGSLSDFVTWGSEKLRRRAKKKPLRLPVGFAKKARCGKYLVLLLILWLCWQGKGSEVSAVSPWTAFSRLHSLNLPTGSGWIGVGILLLLVIGMAVEPRFFCRFLCPMGAIFSLLPVMPWAVVRRKRSNCLKGCKACSRVCPAGIEEIPDEDGGDPGTMGECFSCGKCIRICPKKNNHILPRMRSEVSEAKPQAAVNAAGKPAASDTHRQTPA